MFSSNTTQVSDGGYQISRSLRFNSADTAYLDRTPASASNQKTWTWSGWIKRSASGAGTFFNAGNNGFVARFNSSTDYLEVYNYSGAYQLQAITAQVFRDFSAWYHIVIAIDTTQATSSNRFKLYVNGSQVTTFYDPPTYPSQNADLLVNGTGVHAIGVLYTVGALFSGYMTEINFIDGQALTPSSFGETNAQTGVWQPKAYSGSYGTNGFYLNFSDNSNTTAATLGKDYSGNGNNWTPNNFSVTAGIGNDSLVDSPTSYGTTDTGVGGEIRGNYCTMNPLAKGTNTTLANGNLQAAVTTTWSTVVGTFGMTSGKWYWEYTPSGGTYFVCGVATSKQDLNSYLGDSTFGWNYRWDGQKQTNGASSSYGASFGNGDIVGVAFDADAGTLVFYKNGTSQGTAFSSLTSGPYFPATSGYTAETAYINFGQRPFAYTAPSGYKALCTQNLPTPTIGATTATNANLFFNPVLYTGDRTDRTITVGFQPDWVWVKSRSAADDHYLMNAVVGTGKYLNSNSTAAETTNANSLTAYTSTGFSVGNTGTTNETGRTYVAWNWKANGSGSTNTAGSITSTVSANTTSGFSVVTYTGNGSAGATIGHGLGVAPKMVIVKRRDSAGNWPVYISEIGATKYLYLNATDVVGTYSGFWNNTAPTSSVISIGSDATVNASSGTYVSYCFAEVAGYSKFGSYTGNGSTDGPFVFCGFKPAYIIRKRTDSATDWLAQDRLRIGYNAPTTYVSVLYPNLSSAETQYNEVDILSNGFKIRASDVAGNASGGTYVYMALAENPFKYSLAR